MLYNTGYRGEVDREFIPDTSGITIGSCGHFKLLTLPTFRTQRPGGR